MLAVAILFGVLITVIIIPVINEEMLTFFIEFGQSAALKYCTWSLLVSIGLALIAWLIMKKSPVEPKTMI